MVGSSAKFLPSIKIGDFCTIGAGATVYNSVLVKYPEYYYLLEDTLETNIMDINFVENTLCIIRVCE